MNKKTQTLFVENESKKAPTKFFPLVSLINSYYWYSFFGPFFSFIFPIIILGILGTIFGYETLLGGGLVLPTMATGLISLPLALFEFKRSVLLKRIGATPINTRTFLLILGLYYLFLMIISLFWTMLMYLAIFNEFWETGRTIITAQIPQIPTQISEPVTIPILEIPIKSESLKDLFANVEWSGFLYSHFISMILSITIGFAIVSVSKNVLTLQAIGISIFIFSMFLAAQVIPIANIFNNEIMWFLGFVVSPFKSVSAQSIEAFNGSAVSIIFENPSPNISIVLQSTKTFIWNLNSNLNIYQFAQMNTKSIPVENIFNFATRLINFLIPFLWIGIASGVSLKWFQWGIR
ncbi:hypothetical protein [[Mycoplasma] mobile]|nr:hypothetical protein [[Mycoplasma] mobile]